MPSFAKDQVYRDDNQGVVQKHDEIAPDHTAHMQRERRSNLLDDRLHRNENIAALVEKHGNKVPHYDANAYKRRIDVYRKTKKGSVQEA